MPKISSVRSLSTLKCGICSRVFNSTELCDKHIAKEHVLKLKCKHCNEIFSSSNLYIQHLTAKHTNTDRLVKCTMCFKSFHNIDALHLHCSQWHTFECEHCDDIFKNQENLNQHINDKHVKCDNCDRTFKKKYLLQPHSIHCHKFKCEFCVRTFKSELLLKNHTDLQCNQKNVTEHESILTGENDLRDFFEIERYECEKCNKFFDSFHEFEIHGNTHIENFDVDIQLETVIK